jgi:hypothetical protein
MTDLVQMKLSLPPDLVAYMEDQPARTDRTPSGVIRHWIAEQSAAARLLSGDFQAKRAQRMTWSARHP